MRPAYQTGETIGQFLARLLDRGAAMQALNAVLAAVAAQGDRAALQRTLDVLVADFQARGERALRPRSAAWRDLQAELAAMTARQAAALRSGAPYIMAASRAAAAQSVPELALWGASRAQSAGVRAAWNTPDPEAVQALIERSQRPAFEAAMSQFGAGVVEAVRAVMLRGLVTGSGPLALARELRGVMGNVPRHQAATLARTLQLTSYRDATAVHQAANSHVIERVIRIASLDDRCCLSCIALHGTEIPVGSRVDEHHNGRCVAVSQVRGRQLNVQTGEDWLRSLPESRQQSIMGPAKFAAWKAGAVQLPDFVHRVEDPVFGPMVQEASLRGLLGEVRARTFYSSGGSGSGSATGPKVQLPLPPMNTTMLTMPIARQLASVGVQPNAQPAGVWTPGLPGHQPRVVDVRASQQDLDNLSISMFGRPLTLDEIARFTGAPTGTNVAIGIGDNEFGYPAFVVAAWGPPSNGIYRLEQHIGPSDYEPVYIYHDLIALHPQAQGRGLGRRLVENQVSTAFHAGVERMHLWAVRHDGVFNGYYSWPRFGYNGEIPDDFLQTQQVQDWMGDAGLVDLQEFTQLMRHDRGRELWRRYGDSVYLDFDLTPGSASMRFFSDLLRSNRGRS